MEFIIDFYKGLDTLNLIIFWGIIIVIILLLIFSFILINKNKKLKSLVEKSNKYEEELPIKKEETTIEKNVEIKNTEEKKDNIILPTIKEEPKEENKEQNIISKSIETEKDFVAEEHVMEYNKELFSLSNIKKTNEYKEEKTNYEVNTNSTIQMPTGPYQRNVLREMSLSQTSPIGITRPVQKEDKKIEMAKDLEQSLNNQQVISQKEPSHINKELSPNKEKQINVQTNNQINNQIKKELTNIEPPSPRKTEIREERTPVTRPVQYEKKTTIKEEPKINQTNYKDIVTTEITSKEFLNIQPQIIEEKTRKTSNEKYLEEVSRKLAEAEIPDEIERTNYELKQEEDAIISYKELMEKKDNIQTIDEEEAVISIEELMNRNSPKEEKTTEYQKLYKLSEEEENENFIKELKQFRNDL